jgi:hypothetical protein
VPATRRKEAASALVGSSDRQLLLRFFPYFFLFLTILFVLASSSESYNYSPSRYGERDALRFKAERDETRRELGEVSKKAGIAELEWEHQRRQLLETIDGKFL